MRRGARENSIAQLTEHVLGQSPTGDIPSNTGDDRAGASMPLTGVGRAFRAWLEDRHYALATVRVYVQYVDRLELTGVEVAAATPDDLYDFWSTLPPTSSSRNQCRKALSLFYTSIGQKHGPFEELPSLPEPYRLPRPVENEDYLRLIAAAVELGGIHEVVGLVLAYTGCRINELRTARWAQFELRGGTPVWYIVGKGSSRRGEKTRQVPLHARLAAGLTRWRVDCGSTVFVFPSSRSAEGVLSGGTLRGIVYDICDQAGLDRVVPHRFRHTVATILVERTLDTRATQEWMGHASLATTEHYTKVARTRLHGLMDALPE